MALIRKLIAVLESIERLPLHLYDTPGSTYNLQVSCSRARLLFSSESSRLNGGAAFFLGRS